VKVNVHWHLCEGNGICVADAPEVFDLDEDDNLLVLQDELAEEQREPVENAVRDCPKRALELQD
jgi:ferredoxin